MKKLFNIPILLFLLVPVTFLFSCQSDPIAVPPIRPSAHFPGYWEYKGNAVLLVGGTDQDNIYQKPWAADQLRELASIGGNYIRNTMSARDSGDVQPFFRQPDGLYDLNGWNDEYWERFENMLSTTNSLNIIVQIEIWDRFDFSRVPWQSNAFNPGNNINYTVESGGMLASYPEHPGTDQQPFFHSIPGMPLYTPQMDMVRHFQEKYVEKLLSHTFKYNNVLYCMNNETSTPVEWGQHWMKFIKDKAAEQLLEIYVTDMFEDFYRINRCDECQMSIANPDTYQFIDVSQINSRVFGEDHWKLLNQVMDMMVNYKRPVNTTKVYGGHETSWGSGTHEDGVERFIRNFLGGIAAVRFHRPPYGSGFNEISRAAIRAVRMVEENIKFWEIQPAMELLQNREENEAYVSANFNNKYVVYFPKGGSVDLLTPDITDYFRVIWIGVSPGNTIQRTQAHSTGSLSLEAPNDSGWFAVVLRGLNRSIQQP
jgi:hypothetical protein